MQDTSLAQLGHWDIVTSQTNKNGFSFGNTNIYFYNDLSARGN